MLGGRFDAKTAYDETTKFPDGFDPAARGLPPVKQPAAEPAFSAVLFTATGEFPHDVSAAYGDFTLAGPKADALDPLPRGIKHVAYDPVGKQLYGVSNHRVDRIDLAKGESTELRPPAELPELSWTCGIAFDTKRERVVVVTLGGVGHMYSYSPKADKWAIISELDNRDLAALAYDVKADRLYGLYQSFGGGNPTVGVFNSTGAVVGGIELTDQVFPKKLAQGPVQLVAVGGELAVITDDRIFAVDLKTEKVRVTWTRK